MCETLYFDVDGVLLDFNILFTRFWNNGLKENLWKGKPISDNPTTWSFGFHKDTDDMTELKRAMNIFHHTHNVLPLMHPDIVNVLTKLKSKYTIELVSSYPNEQKRLDDLLCHEIPYDKLTCKVDNKLNHIQNCERNGSVVVAIFEDGPHHLEKFLPHYAGKIWAPNHWNYLNNFKQDPRIRFYNDPNEWITALI